MKGIENILIGLEWSLDTFMDIRKSKEDDGKIDLKDAPRFIDNVTRMPGLIKALPEIPAEALDLDTEEGMRIANLIISKIGCTREEVKAIYKKALASITATAAWVSSGLDLADAIKALKEKA